MKLFLGLLFTLSFLEIIAQEPLSSGGPLKPEQAIEDIRHYKIELAVDITQQRIKGYTVIDLNLLDTASVLLFDLLDSFHIGNLTVNGEKQPFLYQKNMISIQLKKRLAPGRISVRVDYEGKPHIALNPPWGDGFTWTKDSQGNPWVAVTAEAIGGKLFFPCKDHPSDEPNEGAELIITVPKNLVVAGPGLLQKVTVKNGKATYDWKTNYTINNYSIVFNIGNYKVVSREYTTINGNKTAMQFYVLAENQDKAAHHLEILEQTVRSREKYFGEYPWAKEKIGIVETPHLGMEHQTMNAYGNKFRYEQVGGKDFDWLMDHEFGHEWWGNKVTAKDWADYWIHEGINTFGDALDRRELEGEDAYIRNFQQKALELKNKIPVILGKDLDEEAAYQSDIYDKGAFFMHTLRFVIGDSLFFPALKSFVTDPRYTYDNLVTTDDLEQFFSKKSNLNLKPLFNLFLRTIDKMDIHVARLPDNQYQIRLLNLDMDLPLQLNTSNGLQSIRVNKKGIIISSRTLPEIDPNTYYLTRVIIE